MVLDRREFLKGILTSVIVLAAPKVFADLEVNPENLLNHVEVVNRAILLNEDKMDNFLCKLAVHLCKTGPNLNEKQYSNLDLFFSNIPSERMFQFCCFIDPLKRQSEEFLNITKIHLHLIRNPQGRYKEYAYEKTVAYSEYLYRSLKRKQKVDYMLERGKTMLRNYFPKSVLLS